VVALAVLNMKESAINFAHNKVNLLKNSLFVLAVLSLRLV